MGRWLLDLMPPERAALISIPVAGTLQVVARELWQATAWQEPPDGEPPAGSAVPPQPVSDA